MKMNSKIILIFSLALMLLSYPGNSKSITTPAVLVTIKRNYDPTANEKVKLVLNWKELSDRLPGLRASNIVLTDQHYGVVLPVRINDVNGDTKPDQVVFDYTFGSTEPVFTFGVDGSGKGGTLTTEQIQPDGKFEINYLVHFKDPGTGKTIAERIVESTIHTYPDPKTLSIISPGKWTYEYGFFLNGTYQLGQLKNNETYYQYLKTWVDGFIGSDGHLKPESYDQKEYRLDDILPGRLCIWLYQKTGEQKYKNVADDFITHLTKQPKTSEGGYWHKEIYPYQMWLDGIFMGDIFSLQYGTTFKNPHWVDEATLQIRLMYKNVIDPKTGLLYHGWDESKNKVWADPVRGTSPEFWSRAIGWYVMALIEALDYLPQDHPERKSIELNFQKLCASIKNYQDKDNGLWYQVIDKGNLNDNWIETSGSAMFTFAFAKGYHKGLLDKSFEASSLKAFDAM
ncbi:MAG TPA: glycoside hydrolase family 88 protein, partial [Cyclobacteriaceae bacterium]|nr:glycoside hydrolase family 88 protein [Cyclobacteriaceae bacterium]